MRFTFNGQLKGEMFFWRVFPSSISSFFVWIFRQFSLFFSNPSPSFPDTVSIRRGYLATIFCFACIVDHLHRDLSETSKLQKRIPAKSKPGLTGLRGSLTPDVTSRVLEMKEKLWLAGKFPVLDYSSNLWAAAAFWYLIGFHSQNFSGVWFLWTHFSFLGPLFLKVYFKKFSMFEVCRVGGAMSTNM